MMSSLYTYIENKSIGYSAQLPQVLRESGCDYFFTQKLSWNNINKFPLSTFWWTGIDDTSILAHLTPAETYVLYKIFVMLFY